MLEFLLEILVELLFDGAFDAIGRGIARVVRVQAIRIALLVLVVAGIGLGGGYAWGRHAAQVLDGGTPRSLWISLATGVVALGAALGTYRSPDERFGHTPGREPRTWPQRLASLGAFNLVSAAGIAFGAASV